MRLSTVLAGLLLSLIQVGCSRGPEASGAVTPTGKEDLGAPRARTDAEGHPSPRTNGPPKEANASKEGIPSSNPAPAVPNSESVGGFSDEGNALRFDRMTLHARGAPPWASRREPAPTTTVLPPLGTRWHPVSTIEVGFGYLDDAELSSDGNEVFVVSEDEGALRRYDVKSKKLLGHHPYPNFAQFDPITFSLVPESPSRVLFGGRSGIFWLDLNEGGKLPLLTEETDGLLFWPELRFVGALLRTIAPQAGGLVLYRLRDDNTLEPSAELTFSERPDQVVLSRDGTRLAVLFYPSDEVVLYDLAAGTTLRSLSAPTYARGLAWSNDGKLLAVGGNELRLYDAESGTLFDVDRSYGNNINEARFTPDDALLLVSAYDGKARSYSLERPTIPKNAQETPRSTTLLGKKQLLPHRGTANVYALGLTPDGRRLVTSSGDKTIRVWERK